MIFELNEFSRLSTFGNTFLEETMNSRTYLFFATLALLFAFALSRMCEEPEPVGGAPCDTDSDCNDNAPSQYGDNYCNITVTIHNVTTGSCVCAYDYAMVDCEYKRYDKNLAGGLQFLAFAGIGGVGNFVADRTGEGIGQLIMMAAPWFICCVACCGFCCVAGGGSEDGATVLIHGMNGILSCVALGGFIWCMVDAGRFLGGEWADGKGYYPYNGDCEFVMG